MSTIEITSKIEDLKQLEALIEEAKAEAETLRDEIKTEMLNRNTEEMEAGQYIVRWTSVLSQRFDSTTFKKVMPDVYKSFIKQTASRRFSMFWISCGVVKSRPAKEWFALVVNIKRLPHSAMLK